MSAKWVSISFKNNIKHSIAFNIRKLKRTSFTSTNFCRAISLSKPFSCHSNWIISGVLYINLITRFSCKLIISIQVLIMRGTSKIVLPFTLDVPYLTRSWCTSCLNSFFWRNIRNSNIWCNGYLITSIFNWLSMNNSCRHHCENHRHCQ